MSASLLKLVQSGRFTEQELGKMLVRRQWKRAKKNRCLAQGQLGSPPD